MEHSTPNTTTIRTFRFVLLLTICAWTNSLWSQSDDPCGAPALPVNVTCSYIIGTNATATASTGVPSPGCAAYAGGDVWYQITVPASGDVTVQTEPESMTDGGMAIYSGPCNALTLIECDDDDGLGAMPAITLIGQTPGATLFVRVWEFGNNNNGTFEICAQAYDPCGGTSNNDWCQAPATLTPGAGNFSSNTSSTFSSDTPANLNALFCGSIENNSWYAFVASSTTETFDFSSVSGCTYGVQAQVFDITYDANGCCTSLTSVSNCWSPGTATTGTVTATGLTIGETYVLMVDGFFAAVCDFTVNNWLATGIYLPVELVSFFGTAIPQENILKWQTASEIDNDHFLVSRSLDGMEFEAIGTVDGVGNSTTLTNYEFSDPDIRTGLIYYQLTQVDINGTSVQSEIIALNRSHSATGLLGVFPTPTKDVVNVEINTSEELHGVTIELSDASGQLIEAREINTNGFGLVKFNIEELRSGMYFVRYISSSGFSTIKKIIKN